MKEHSCRLLRNRLQLKYASFDSVLRDKYNLSLVENIVVHIVHRQGLLPFPQSLLRESALLHFPIIRS